MTTAKLTQLAPGVVMAAPSPRIRVLFDNANRPEQKAIAYLGFDTEEAATRLRTWLLQHGSSSYQRKTDNGINKPRKAERVPGVVYELKWHRPDPEMLSRVIAKDLSRCCVVA
jgi:hypothetical protein